MMSRDVSGHVPKRSQQTETRAKVGNSVSSPIALPTPSVRHTGVMLGEYLTALLIAVLGYVYPAYLCFKVRSVPSAIPTPPSLNFLTIAGSIFEGGMQLLSHE